MADEQTDPERRSARVVPAGVRPSWGTAQAPPPEPAPQASLLQAGCGDRAPPAGCWHGELGWPPPHTPAGHGDEPTPLSITASCLACPHPPALFRGAPDGTSAVLHPFTFPLSRTTYVAPISQISRLRPRQVKEHTRGPTASKHLSRARNRVHPRLEPTSSRCTPWPL